mmetsp:Transcript_1029/g.1520  ORF Transcript_1029/g.1520 Transcript_1029/m.1520 type:complete len:269 (+) Transcript_1029:102-908(+)
MNFQTVLLFHVALSIFAAAQDNDKTVVREVWTLGLSSSRNYAVQDNNSSSASTTVLSQRVPEISTISGKDSGETALEISSLFMFNTGTGVDLVEYLREKLDEEEAETFQHDKSLIDAMIVEYHKFLELTKNWIDRGHDNFAYIPSKSMDLVWHWHILQTYEYHLMCNQQFGKFLHHRPFFGQEKQAKAYKSRHINKYKRTLRDYYRYFGYYPPNMIWATNKFSNLNSVADCDEMHTCDANMALLHDCDEMHACDAAAADCQMHACDSD